MAGRLLSPAPPQVPPEVEDDVLLSEILLRLPALPSSLLRDSLVCRRWRRLASDPDFLTRFRVRYPVYDARETMWYYEDPTGAVQGPVTMQQLRVWKRSGYFRKDFRVWEGDQTIDQSILLVDAAMLTAAPAFEYIILD